MQNTKAIIKKWYERLGFPKEFDAEFYIALDNIEIPEDVTIETYDKNTDDGKRHLLTFLYLCEGLDNQKYLWLQLYCLKYILSFHHSYFHFLQNSTL